MIIRRLLPLTALLLAGCSMAPAYERSAAPVPQQWPTGQSYAADYASLPSASYRELFRDDGLQALIAQALRNNRDLQRAAANIERARAQFQAQRAALLPEVDAGLSGTSQESRGTPAVTSMTASLSIPSYEIDLFGRLRSLSDAARNSYFATQADEQTVRLALTGDITSAWLLHAADSTRLALASATAAAAQKSVELTQARLTAGVAPRTDLRQAQTILATAQSDVARYTTLVAQDRNLITLLAGAPIEQAWLASSIEEASARIAAPPTGLSTEVLLRRPDVMSAEYSLRAANAQIGAARAALFPRITLAGLIGLVGPSLEALFDDGATQLTQATGSATYPIFAGGGRRANLAAAQAQQKALLAAYEKAIQVAYREVSDALAREGTISTQLAADRLRVTAAQDAYRLADARYRGGVDRFLQALDAQRSYYAAQTNLVTTLLTAANNHVALYRALGGEAAAQ